MTAQTAGDLALERTDVTPWTAEPFSAQLNQELRTHLNAIMGFARTLQAQPDNLNAAENVRDILKAAAHLLEVIDRRSTNPPILRDEPVLAKGTNAVTCDILYIEDDAVNFALVSRIFEKRPHIHLRQSTCGEDGIKMALANRPQLILLDLNLPDIHGSEVLRRLQEDLATACIPVVVISADATPSQIERLLSAGAHNYVTKPFNIQKLLGVIDDILETF